MGGGSWGARRRGRLRGGRERRVCPSSCNSDIDAVMEQFICLGGRNAVYIKSGGAWRTSVADYGWEERTEEIQLVRDDESGPVSSFFASLTTTDSMDSQ